MMNISTLNANTNYFSINNCKPWEIPFPSAFIIHKFWNISTNNQLYFKIRKFLSHPIFFEAWTNAKCYLQTSMKYFYRYDRAIGWISFVKPFAPSQQPNFKQYEPICRLHLIAVTIEILPSESNETDNSFENMLTV